MTYAFKAAGDLAAIGNGNYRSARSLYDWFRSHGKASRTNPKPGDLVIWGNGSHVGIYIGNGQAISTLTSGVRVHGVFAVTASFTAYLHTGMSGKLISGATTSTATTTTTTRTRATTTSLNLRTGTAPPRPGSRSCAAGRTLRVPHAWKDASGRTWYNVTTGTTTGWIAGWYTRSA